MSVLNAKLNFSFLCDYSSVSREGKLSMNGIFENINVHQLPTHHPLMFIVANISGVNNKDKFTCELVADDQSQKQIASISQEVKVDPKRNFGFIGQFVNVRYEAAGNYLIKFYIDNKEIGSHSYKVRQV
ncbi:MAG: hypothetical protein KJ915_10430 [Candidatus Omnitrophica bacterium]|nr:hypothetical protein [Candidatus Omnitrophota bacterium]